MKFLDGVTRAGEAVAAVCVGAMAVFYTLEVVGRYAFASPLNWSGDVSSYLLLACVFLMLPRVTQAGLHVTVTFLEDRLPPALRKRYAVALSRCCGVFCLIAAAFVTWECMRQFREDVLTTQATSIPRWWLAAVAAAGLFVAAIHFLLARKAGVEDDAVQVERQS